MSKPLKFLILEDNPFDVEILQRLLNKAYAENQVKVLMSKEDYTHTLETFQPHVILADNSLPQFNATAALQILKERNLDIPFILITGTVSEEFAAEVIKNGADDYILKDRLTRLPSAIERALQLHQTRLDQQVALQKVIEREEEYRTLIERISDGFMALNEELEITFVNPQAEDILQRPRGYLKGKKVKEEFEGRIDGPFFNGCLKALQTGRNVQMEEYSMALNKWINATMYPSATGVSVYFKDITEQRNAQIEAGRSEERYRTFVERITDAFITLDKNWNYSYLNRQAGELLQKDSESLIGKNIWEVFPDAVGSATYYALHKAMNEQHYVTNTDYYSPLDLWQENHIYPSEDGLTMFIRDITERKKLEFELLDQQRKETIKLTATVLEAQEKERNAIGIELHDNVNQILASTRLILSMLKVAQGNGQELIHSCMENLQTAIDENRKISHMMVSPDLNTLGLSDQIQQLVKTMLETAEIKTMLRYSVSDEHLLPAALKLAVYRIAQEQCNNIIKHADAKNVQIEIEADNNRFIMAISDDGAGMFPEKLTEGIGLRNIKGRLSIFNGVLKIDTAPRKGFRLEIVIPLSNDTSTV